MVKEIFFESSQRAVGHEDNLSAEAKAELAAKRAVVVEQNQRNPVMPGDNPRIYNEVSGSALDMDLRGHIT